MTISSDTIQSIEPFLEAVSGLNVEPALCAYLDSRIFRDTVGCKRAGFGLGLIIEPSEGPRVDEQDQALRPDAVIHSLTDLLDIFPMRNS